MLDLVSVNTPDQCDWPGGGAADRNQVFVRYELTMLLTEFFAGGAVDDEHVLIMTDGTRE